MGTRPAQAAQGNPVLLGDDVSGATHRTGLFSTTGEVAVLSDPGNDGGTPGSVGVWGIANDFGVYGQANTNTGGYGVAGFGDTRGYGMYAQGGSNGGDGIHAIGGEPDGYGIVASGGTSGIGVEANGGLVGVKGLSFTDTGGTGVQGLGDGSGPGVAGIGGAGGVGVMGTGGASNGIGVSGTGNGSGSGVKGIANGAAAGVAGSCQNGEGVYARSGLTEGTTPGTTRNGMHGVTDSPTASGVWGEAVSGGVGVTGSTTSAAAGGVQGINYGAGPGVIAQNNAGGTALLVHGPALFSRSGILTIAAGKASATKGGANGGIALTTSSLVLCAIQGNVAGIYVQGVTVVTGSSGSFTIHLNQATPSALRIAWFVVN